MLAIILLFLGVFSVINPIQEKLDSCKKIGTDLKVCKETAECKFYEITQRRTWDLDHALQVAIKAPDGATYAWYSGNITSIDGLYITVSRNGCNSSVDNEIPCTVRESRFSFRFRESTPFEFVGMRIEVYREYFSRWISTNLTAIKSSEGDKWDDLWAFGGEFGDIIGLTPFEIRASTGQDCQLDPDVIPTMAETIANSSAYSQHGKYCAQIYKEDLCTDNTWETLNCEWHAENATCLLSEQTNILIDCWALQSDEYGCTANSNCKWIAPTMDDNSDSYCINSSSTLSVLFLALVLLFLC